MLLFFFLILNSSVHYGLSVCWGFCVSVQEVQSQTMLLVAVWMDACDCCHLPLSLKCVLLLAVLDGDVPSSGSLVLLALYSFRMQWIMCHYDC